jgi:hypothetical protein
LISCERRSCAILPSCQKDEALDAKKVVCLVWWWWWLVVGRSYL